MKKMYLLIFCCACFVGFCCAQRVTIQGKVIDSSLNQTLHYAVVCLLNAKDSMLQNFTRVNEDGGFNLINIDTGKYILLVTYPKYAAYSEMLNVDGKIGMCNLGTINMIGVEHLLQDVIVTQQVSSIKIKGDTTEFMAGNFKTQPNATVEDLLKKFPGFQVDKNGTITAQGKHIKKVLVDGEEFFGDDPTLATKNLRADMVSSVQLYDKSSDQASFTGINDGQKSTTLNIKLKQNKKNGYFGKVSGGIGTSGYKETQDMLNYFKGKMKIAGYLTLANTGKIGLGFQDEEKYGTNDDVVDAGENGAMNVFSTGSSDPLNSLASWDGNYDGEGIPNAKTGGIHFDKRWQDDNEYLNLNYKIGSVGENGFSKTIAQNNLPNDILFSNSNNRFYKDIFRQKADGIYEIQLDSMSSLKIGIGASVSHSTMDNFSEDSTTNRGHSLVNRSFDSSRFRGSSNAFNINILWRQKFKKKGRTISLFVNEFLNNIDDKGFINNHSNFFNNQELLDSTYLLDQRKEYKNNSNSFFSKLTYTEPLSNALSLAVNYSLGVENANSNISSFNPDQFQNYSVIDSLYTSYYVYNQLLNSGGFSFIFNKSKMLLEIGTNFGSSQYHQNNTFDQPNERLDRKFVNWNPNVNFQYKFAQTTDLNFQYSGMSQQPTITQIQPIANNTDNLNIYIGNPLLRPSFSNNFSLYFNNFKILSQRGLFFNGNYNFIINPITANAATNDTTGGSIYKYSNISTSTYNYNLFGGINKKFKKLNIQGQIDFGINGNKYAYYINDVFNISKTNMYNFGLGLYKDKEKAYSLNMRINVAYNTTSYTLQSQSNNNYWSYTLIPNFDVYLPAKFQIHTDGNYQWNEKTTAAPGYHQFIWNAWLGKSVFKNDNLLLKISCDDILNQNNGFSRTPNSNGGFQQIINSTIRRYYMFSIVWNFSKMGASEKTIK